MRLELDAKSIIHEAVVEVLADQDTSKTSNSSVQSWITSLAEESMESGRGYRIEQSMSNFALQLEVEAVKLLRQNHSFPKKEDIKELQEELKTIIDELRKKTLELCHEIKAIFDELKLPQSEYTPYQALSNVLRLEVIYLRVHQKDSTVINLHFLS